MGAIKLGAVSLSALLMAAPAFAQLDKDDVKDLNEATAVLGEIRSDPDRGIPDGIWQKADCVVVIPSLKKAGFIVGGEGGDGVLSCRRGATWTAPIFMELTKGSIGLQAGVQSTELVLLIMNRKGLDRLLSNKVTLGVDASVAAGPVGRTASAATDAQMTAEMLSYSHSKGVFAGIDLSGGSLRPDKDANARAYGKNVTARDVALGTAQVEMAPAAKAFRDALGRARDTRGTTGVR
jgi:lipid-binding SYLF domain-containing protein